jgi:hypothetical protein
MGPALVKIVGSWVEFLFHGYIYKPDIIHGRILWSPPHFSIYHPFQCTADSTVTDIYNHVQEFT